MKFWITLEGREAEVELHKEDGRLWIEVEGRRIEADVLRLPDGEVYSLLIDGRSHEVRVSPEGEGLEVSMRGATLPVVVRNPIEKALLSVTKGGASGDVETISAPMPGLVVAIKVKPGDAVKPGQAVAIVEAMKMQNELATRHGGEVAEVLVSEGASVGGGAALLRIRPGRS